MESRSVPIENEKTPFDVQAIKDLLTTELKTVIDYRAKQAQQDSLKDHQTFISYVLGPTLLNKYHVKPKNILQVTNIRAINDATKKMLAEHMAVLIKIIHIFKSPSVSEFDCIQINLLLGLLISQKYNLFKMIENTTKISPGIQYLLDGSNIWFLRDAINLRLLTAYELFKPMILVVEDDKSHCIYADWKKWRTSIYERLGELDGLIEGDGDDSIYTQKRRAFLDFLSKSIIDMQPEKGVMKLDKDNISPMVAQLEKIYPIIKEHLDYLKSRQELIAHYHQYRFDIDKKLMQLESQYRIVKNMVKKIKSLKQSLSEERSEVLSLTNALWPEQFPENIVVDASAQKTLEFMLSKSLVSIEAFIIKLNLTEEKLLKDQEKHLQTMSIAEEYKMLSVSQEASLFKQQQAQKLKQFEDEVASKRKEKLLLEPSSISNQTAIPASNEKEAQSVSYGNSDFAITYSKLSRNKKALLKSILNQESGLRYRKVMSLFTTLGGTITEIGNGSSHKRLKLPQVEATATVDAPKEAPMVTGGVFRPSDPKIPQAGLALINDLFEKARISLTLVEWLDAEDENINNNASKEEVNAVDSKQSSRKL